MKGFEYKTEKTLISGLRRWGEKEKDDNDGLVECYNLAPDKAGLRIHEPLSFIHGYQAFLLIESSTFTYLTTEDGVKIRLI